MRVHVLSFKSIRNLAFKYTILNPLVLANRDIYLQCYFPGLWILLYANFHCVQLSASVLGNLHIWVWWKIVQADMMRKIILKE